MNVPAEYPRIAWTAVKHVPARVTTVQVPTIDVRAVRRRLGLSQSEFAAKFGFQAATLRTWEQGRTRPDGPARVLLTVIARRPEAVVVVNQQILYPRKCGYFTYPHTRVY